MRKTFAIGMSLLLVASCAPVYAENTQPETENESAFKTENDTFSEDVSEENTYELGDKIEDFTVTLADGSEVSLYQLLSEKKGVLINLWASWCGPCKSEFPVMQEAYDEVSDEIGIVALSLEPTDTDEIVNQLKEDLGLTTLPMGVDTIGLNERFVTDSIPVSIMVDRNGVICFIESGAITDKKQFLRLFKTFTADDYDEPQLLESIPAPLPDVEAPSPEEMKAAIGTDGMEFSAAEGEIWPFVLSDDGTSLKASNGDEKGTIAAFGVEVNVEEGQALSYEYATSCLTYYQGLYVNVDGENQAILSGDTDWKEAYIQFDEPGEHTVYFTYMRDSFTEGDTSAAVRNIRLISDEDAKTALEEQSGVKTLEGSEVSIETIDGETKDATLVIAAGDSTSQGSGVTYPIMQSDEMTVRICIGDELDVNDVFFTDGTYYYMLNELPTDDKGYLYTINAADSDPNASLAIVDLKVYPSIKEALAASEGIDEVTESAVYDIVPSEKDMDQLADYFAAFIQNLGNGQDGEDEVKVTWSYADGSAKKETEEASEAESDSENAANTYTVYVADEAGNPISNVMVQVCDDTTCQVFFTDDQGSVLCWAGADSYDVHILKVPDGYEKPDDLFGVGKDQKSLSITLKKAE